MTGAARIDTSAPHPARVYDWFLGGKDNYPVDEELGRRIMSVDGTARHIARTNRWFMQRVTRWLAGPGAYASSWTSAPAYRPSPTCTRSRRTSRRSAASSTPTTTPSC